MERLFPERLAPTLHKGLHPFYLLTGQDLLLVGEAKTQIVAAARAQEFDEKVEFDIDSNTAWTPLFEQVQSVGLFFSRQVMVLNLPDSLPVATQKNLQELINLSHSDLILIFHLPKFSKTIEKQAWLSAIDSQVIAVNCTTPDLNQLQRWVKYRADSMNLALDADALQLLCYNYEGNLLALKQTLQLLQLRFGEQKIGVTKATEIVEQSSQFSPFQWVDALFGGKVGRAERILQHLKNEEVQPVVLARIIQKELVNLLELTRPAAPLLNSHQPLATANLRNEFNRLKIWSNRQPIYLSAIQRFSYHKLYALIQQLATIERKIKQEFSDDIWQEFAAFSAAFK